MLVACVGVLEHALADTLNAEQQNLVLLPRIIKVTGHCERKKK
jgi:ribosomal protein S15P/S13E